MQATTKKASSLDQSPKKRAAAPQIRNDPSIIPYVSPVRDTCVQPKSTCACGGSCPRCRAEQFIQPKLKISAPDDKYEWEADRVADQVIRMPEVAVQRQETPEDKEEEEKQIQTKPISESITPLVQRLQGDEEPGLNEEKEELVQTMTVRDETPATTPAIPPQSLQGSGMPLTEQAREFFESRMGHDLGDVRIHTGTNATAAAQSINARAFTMGKDVVFNKGEYSPESTEGKRLLAHELTHVVQQNETIGIQRQEMDPLVEQAAAFTLNEIQNALLQGYIWGFEAQLLNNLVYPRRARVLQCRADQLWRLVRLLRRVTNWGEGGGQVTWNPEFSSLRVRRAVGALIGRDIWRPMHCGDVEYPNRYANYIGSRTDRSFPRVRVPPAYEWSTLPPVPGENPEIEETLSGPLRDLLRELIDNPENHRFRRFLVRAGELEVVERERNRGGGTGVGATAVRPPEGSAFINIQSDASPIALSLVNSDETLLQELETLPDDEALRYLDLLGTQLTYKALWLMAHDPGFLQEVIEAVRRFREGLRHYREQHPPQERSPRFPEFGNIG